MEGGGGNRWETGMESAEWIRVRVLSSRGDKRGTLEWKKSLDNVFNFFQEADGSSPLRPIPAWNALRSHSFHFLLFGIDRFFQPPLKRSDLIPIRACQATPPPLLNWQLQVQLLTL